jgi:hypothetical protein
MKKMRIGLISMAVDLHKYYSHTYFVYLVNRYTFFLFPDEITLQS